VQRDAATGLYTIQNVLTVDANNRFLAANPGLYTSNSIVSRTDNLYKWSLQGFNQVLRFRFHE